MISLIKITTKQNKKFTRNYSTLLTFVRHAQSAGNAKRPITFTYSQYPITELGECQAEKFASSFYGNKHIEIFYSQIKSQVKNIQFDSTHLKINDDYDYKINVKKDLDLIISSPFRRAIDTSKYLHKKYRKSEYTIDNRLRAFTYLDEPYYTSLRYCRDKEIKNYWEKLDPLLVSGKGAESFKAFYERTLSFFYDIIESGENWKHQQIKNIKSNSQNNNFIRLRNIVCFTHAMSCRMLELLKFGLLPCCQNESINAFDSSKLLNTLKTREKGVSIKEAKEVMKIYRDFRKHRTVVNCESISCLL